MEHLLLKAAITAATDQGRFSAVISAASIDREKDIVDPAGMVRALRKWIETGKNIPLAWNHSAAPEHQIGYIDPASARVKGGEVVADGFIDQSTDSGAHAWRQVKMGTLGFSFSYLVPDGGSTRRKGGGRLLREFDVFEVTASPTPMNNDTRVLGWKADVPTEEAEQDTLETVLELLSDFLDTEDDAQDIAAARDILTRVQALLSAENAEAPDGKSAAEQLRAKADAVALEHVSGGQKPGSEPEPEPEPESESERGKSLAELFTDDEIEALLAPEAKARIPKSDLPQAVKDLLAGKAQRILDEKSVDGTAQAPGRAVDPLRAKAEALALEHASGGQSLQKSPPQAKQAPPPDLLPLRELKERMRAEMLTALSGGHES